MTPSRSWAPGGWAAPWPAPCARRIGPRPPEPDPGGADALADRARCTVGRRPRPRPRRQPTSRSRCSPTVQRSRRSTADPMAWSPARDRARSSSTSSTVPPRSSAGFEAAVRDRGLASSTRRSRAASPSPRAGQLTIMVGGRAEDLERARPVLEQLATPIFHIGPLGSGAAMKLAVNTVIFGLNEALAEALVLAERPASTASAPTTSSPPARSARRSSATSGTHSSTPTARRSPSRRPRREGPAPDPRAAGRRRGCPRRRQPETSSGIDAAAAGRPRHGDRRRQHLRHEWQRRE